MPRNSPLSRSPSGARSLRASCFVEYRDSPGFSGISGIFRIFLIFWIFMGSQRSGRHLESFLEPVRFILTEYGPISSHVDPISLIFWIFDIKVASTGPRTPLKRCGPKFCVGWWSGHLHSSHMDPIGEKTVPRPYTLYPCMYDWIC